VRTYRRDNLYHELNCCGPTLACCVIEALFRILLFGAKFLTPAYLMTSGFGISIRVRDIRVNTWAELNEELFADTWNQSIGRFRSDFVYKGMCDARWTLSTTLMRLGGNYHELEAHLLRNFKKYATHSAVPTNSEWNWLAVAQHHGLPTRLLDWTYSPYVALHFATDNVELFDTDGVIWAVNFVKVHELLPRRLRTLLRRERSNSFAVETLGEAASNLAALEKLSHNEFALFFETPALDARIVNQYALFSLMSSPGTRLDEWLNKQGEDFARRIIIPADLKWETRDKLDQANITERVLFPGLDGLSRWLRRQYLPREEFLK
jgi:hypothetical protein